MTLHSVLMLYKRWLAAREFGIKFYGSRAMKFPSMIWKKDQSYFLEAPKEKGCASDFINLFLDDEYGLKKIKVPPEIIIDIGANIGLFSVLARYRFPNAKIQAFEPNERIFQFLIKNTHNLDVDVRKAAVGLISGFVSMNDLADSRIATAKFCSTGSVPMVAISSPFKVS